MKTSIVLGLLLFLGACHDGNMGGAFQNDEVKLKIFLRTAPGDQQDITFMMEHFEILFEHEGERGAVITGKKVKELPLKKMVQKVPLTMAPVKLAAGSLVKEIRLVLKPDEHILRRLDGSVCMLSLYNGETSINAPADGVRLESGMNYALILELAADSITLDLGEEGGCTARPEFSFRALRPMNYLSMTSVDEWELDEEEEILAEKIDYGI